MVVLLGIGVMKCSECVRKHKLSKGEYKYKAIDCGVNYNDDSCAVRWFLCRTGRESVDGVCWYINSYSGRYKRNCEIVNEGFDSREMPVTYVITTVDINQGNELLLDYLGQKK